MDSTFRNTFTETNGDVFNTHCTSCIYRDVCVMSEKCGSRTGEMSAGSSSSASSWLSSISSITSALASATSSLSGRLVFTELTKGCWNTHGKITQNTAQTYCASVWYGNSSNQDCKALQRVVRLAERISGSTLPSLQDIYLKRCKSRAAKIKDSNHPGNHLFCLLPSGKRFRSMMAKTERLRRSFFPQAIRLLNTNSVS